MLSAQDKVRHVIGSYFLTKGWKHVFYPYSGVLKHGKFLFVLYKGKGTDKASDTIQKDTVASALVTQEPVACSWHLEYQGWLLSKGNISTAISAQYKENDDYSVEELTVVEELYNTGVAAFLNMSDIELCKYKTRNMTCICKAYQDTFKVTSKSVRSTMFFALHNDYDDLQKNTPYQIIDVHNGKLVIRAVSEQTLKPIGDFLFVRNPQELLAMERSNLVPLEITKDYRDSISIVEKKGTDVQLPKETKKLPVDDNVFSCCNQLQLSFIELAFNLNLNFTPLIFMKEFKALEIMFSLLQNDINPGLFIHKKFTFEQLQKYHNLMNANLKLDIFVNEEYTPSYLDLLYNDYTKLYEQLRGDYCAKGFAPAVAMRMAYYLGSVSNIDSIVPKNAKSEYAVDLSIYSNDEGYSYCADYLMRNGIEGSSFYYATFDHNDTKLKAFFRKYFAMSSVMFKGKDWSDIIEEVLQTCMYIVYHSKLGFMLSTSQFYFGRSYNTVQIRDCALKPCWSATVFTKGVIINDASEKEIYI